MYHTQHVYIYMYITMKTNPTSWHNESKEIAFAFGQPGVIRRLALSSVFEKLKMTQMNKNLDLLCQ